MSSNDELEATAEPVATGVEFYKAVNARNNHSGRGLAFDGGCLNLKKDGSGEFVFDRDAEIVSEEGKDLLIARIPASEIEFLRDYLAEAFPAARPVPDAEPAPPARQDALREALVDAAAHLRGAASAYREHAARHRSVGRAKPDPFFTTRASDFEKAADRAAAALAQSDAAGGE